MKRSSERSPERQAGGGGESLDTQREDASHCDGGQMADAGALFADTRLSKLTYTRQGKRADFFVIM